MNEASPEILIIGGGVAGMSAALALKDQNVAVHLVEQAERLGGNAGAWACMATDTCQNCGACLVREMAAQVETQTNLTLHLQARLTDFKRSGDVRTAKLSTGTVLTPARVIMATGFSPFDPLTLPSYHTQTLDRVITTADLNTLIREEKLNTLTGPAPRIAFLQCVGSRDRANGRDYCSQVCCKISMRHAKKLLHLLPEARISLFYMDLQIIGKEARTQARELSAQVDLIQGVPAEILESAEGNSLRMVTEDPATMSRTAMDFDLVVLSVGMTPPPGQKAVAGLLGAAPNAWGFFNTDEARLPDDIIPAGCAQGPKDITSAMQDGQIAAARAIKDLAPQGLPPGAVDVIGEGEAAMAAARAVLDKGFPLYCFGSHDTLPPNARDMRYAKILAIDGTTGRFTIFHEINGKKAELECAAVIAAPRPDLTPAAQGFGSTMALNAFCQSPPGDLPERVAILLDYAGPENKAASREALTAALAAADAGRTVFILMNKMLVHGPEGQKTYDQARKAGVRCLRYQGHDDLLVTPGDNKFSITLKEATLGKEAVLIETDALVLPETVTPAQGFKDLAALMGMDLDREGFLQSPNVRHRLVHSPRRGIFVAGPCHDETDAADLEKEIAAILATLALQSPVPDEARPVVINEKKCAQCLTCYRVCPHGAIIINEKRKPQIMADACFGCHTCMANCPAYAIESEGFETQSLVEKARESRTLILACERSGALAAGHLPEKTDLIPIPCACRISSDMLLSALIKGVDKIIVSACHDGNCRSGIGGRTAEREVARVLAVPAMPQEKLKVQTVAANEPQTFARLIS